MTMHSLVGPAAIGASNGSAKKSSLLRRLYDAVIAHRTAQAEEQVARYLATHRDKFTDEIEREIERRFSR
jgi:hypothetical protein